jgi:tetratricopeptide (TPR) repeat protein
MRTFRTLVPAAVLLALLATPAGAGALEDGRTHLAAKRWPEAAAAFEKALEPAPPSKDAAVGYAEAVVGGKIAASYEKASSALQAALKGAPEDRDLRLALARVFAARGETDERWHADVEAQYRRILKANPDDEDAVAGLGLMYLARADHKRGLETLDAYLEKNPNAGKALRAKGEILYDQAVVAFRDGGGQKLTPAAKELFEKAHAAFVAATAAGATSFDAWLKRGYTAQYLGKVDDAGVAYERAIDLDPTSVLPLKALEATFRPKWNEKIAALVRAHPNAAMAQYYYAHALLVQGKPADAEKALRRYQELALTSQGTHGLLAKILLEKGDEKGAAKAFEKALEENPNDLEVLAALQVPLVDRVREAVGDNAKLKSAVADYRKLLAMAPQNPGIRNDLGFLLREAFGPNGTKSSASRPRWILDESVKAYEEASALIGEWRDEYQGSIRYPARHANAQVLNDTGLMFQYYPEVQDLAKAEAYYRRAQEWTQHGYWDAYTNLLKILRESERWADALEYAEACAEGLRDESGEANATFRATARGDAEQIRKRLPK